MRSLLGGVTMQTKSYTKSTVSLSEISAHRELEVFQHHATCALMPPVIQNATQCFALVLQIILANLRDRISPANANLLRGLSHVPHSNARTVRVVGGRDTEKTTKEHVPVSNVFPADSACGRRPATYM